MSDSVRPHRWQPTRLPRPWDSPGKNTAMGCHFLLQCMKVKSESEVTQLCLTLVTPWTAAYQGPLTMGSSRQEYWSGVPSPSPYKRVLLLSHFSRVQLFATPWTAAYRAPPSMGFSRQEYWSGVPLPSPRTTIRPSKSCHSATNKVMSALYTSVFKKFQALRGVSLNVKDCRKISRVHN